MNAVALSRARLWLSRSILFLDDVPAIQFGIHYTSQMWELTRIDRSELAEKRGPKKIWKNMQNSWSEFN